LAHIFAKVEILKAQQYNDDANTTFPVSGAKSHSWRKGEEEGRVRWKGGWRRRRTEEEERICENSKAFLFL